MFSPFSHHILVSLSITHHLLLSSPFCFLLPFFFSLSFTHHLLLTLITLLFISILFLYNLLITSFAYSHPPSVFTLTHHLFHFLSFSFCFFYFHSFFFIVYSSPLLPTLLTLLFLLPLITSFTFSPHPSVSYFLFPVWVCVVGVGVCYRLTILLETLQEATKPSQGPFAADRVQVKFDVGFYLFVLAGG